MPSHQLWIMTCGHSLGTRAQSLNGAPGDILHVPTRRKRFRSEEVEGLIFDTWILSLSPAFLRPMRFRAKPSLLGGPWRPVPQRLYRFHAPDRVSIAEVRLNSLALTFDRLRLWLSMKPALYFSVSFLLRAYESV